MKKKYKALSKIAVVTMIVCIITISTVSVSAEQHGSIALEYNHTDPAENEGNAAGTGQNEQAQTNVKTGDATASVAGGLSLAAIISAGTAWFALKKAKS